MKKSIFLLVTLLATTLFAMGCGNAGGSSNTGSDAPGAVNIQATLSPPVVTTSDNDVMVTVKVAQAGAVVPDGTTVNLGVDGGSLVAVGGEAPTTGETSSLAVTTTGGAASAWWIAPRAVGTHHLTVSVLGTVVVKTLEVK